MLCSNEQLEPCRFTGVRGNLLYIPIQSFWHRPGCAIPLHLKLVLWCHVRRDVVVPRRCDGSDRGSDHVCEYLLKLALCNSCFCGRMKKKSLAFEFDQL